MVLPETFALFVADAMPRRSPLGQNSILSVIVVIDQPGEREATLLLEAETALANDVIVRPGQIAVAGPAAAGYEGADLDGQQMLGGPVWQGWIGVKYEVAHDSPPIVRINYREYHPRRRRQSSAKYVTAARQPSFVRIDRARMI